MIHHKYFQNKGNSYKENMYSGVLSFQMNLSEAKNIALSALTAPLCE